MEPACSWRVSSHVPWAGGGWGAGGEGAVTHASGGPGARRGCGANGEGACAPGRSRWCPVSRPRLVEFVGVGAG